MSIFSKFGKPKIRDTYTIEDKKLLEVIKAKNRMVLSGIDNWLTEEQSQKSYYNYGVPDPIRNLLDLEIGEETTYTDMLLYYAKKISKVNYLELGVSVGKNFIQFASQLENASLTGFDIENINTPIANKFHFQDRTDWPTRADSIRKENSTLSRFTFGSNAIHYLAGDIWDEDSWARLSGQKFNIIFSDALHDARALLWEYEMIEKYKLLDADFIYIWDDLNNGLEESFKTIAADLKKKRQLKSDAVSLIKINGWLGKNYPLKHDVGIVSNILLK